MIRPEVRRAFAVGDARRLWRLYGFHSPKDLVLEDVAFAMGVIVVEDRLDSADARLIRSATRGIIRVNSAIRWPGRKRFAIAHELGHWSLHAKLSQLLACTSEDMRATYQDSEPEGEANWFAAELLMPHALFAAAMGGTVPSPDVINSLANEFAVSTTAACVRYAELASDPTIFIYCENGRIRWWRSSRDIEGAVWIKSGSPVSRRTLAGRYFDGDIFIPETQTIGIDEWAERYPQLDDEIMEGMIPLGGTGGVVVMLWCA